MGIDVDDIRVGRRLQWRVQPEKSSEFSNYLHNNRPILAPAAANNKAAKNKKDYTKQAPMVSISV
jgi:hypothetical protein